MPGRPTAIKFRTSWGISNYKAIERAYFRLSRQRQPWLLLFHLMEPMTMSSCWRKTVFRRYSHEDDPLGQLRLHYADSEALLPIRSDGIKSADHESWKDLIEMITLSFSSDGTALTFIDNRVPLMPFWEITDIRGWL